MRVNPVAVIVLELKCITQLRRVMIPESEKADLHIILIILELCSRLNVDQLIIGFKKMNEGLRRTLLPSHAFMIDHETMIRAHVNCSSAVDSHRVEIGNTFA